MKINDLFEYIKPEAPMSPSAIAQKSRDLSVASRKPNSKISVKQPSGNAELRSFKGIVDDPDDPKALKVAVASEKEGEFDLIDMSDAELIEEITRLSGINNENR